MLTVGKMFFGIGKAFLSGSLESLIIEDCIRRNGITALTEASSANLVYQCGGIAAGALLGGFLKEPPSLRETRGTLKNQTYRVAAPFDS